MIASQTTRALRTHTSTTLALRVHTTTAGTPDSNKSVQLGNSAVITNAPSDTAAVPATGGYTGVMVVQSILGAAHKRKTTAGAARTTEHNATSAIQPCRRHKTGPYASR